MKPNSLSRQERLKSRKEISELLLKGKSTFGFPFKAVYHVYSAEELSGETTPSTSVGISPATHRIMVSVPKKNFKRAVMRNLLKRRTREAYRLNKQLLSLQTGRRVSIMFVYVAKTELPYAAMERAVCNILYRIKEAINEEN